MAQVTIKQKFIHQAPRKLRLVSDMVRGLPAETAAAELNTLSQTASKEVRKAILAAIAAAKQQGLNAASLFVSAIMVDEGPKMRRFIPLSKGRSSRILKRMSHVTVSLTDEAMVIASSKAYKRELAGQIKKSVSKKAAKAEAVSTPEPVVAETTTETPEAAEGSK